MIGTLATSSAEAICGAFALAKCLGARSGVALTREEGVPVRLTYNRRWASRPTCAS